MAAAALAVLLLLLLPSHAWAWGPATHVYLGTGVLESLHLIPDFARALVAGYPHDFLYGSVAADISLGKKYAPIGRHCHHWHVGEEIFAEAESDRLRAVGLGYLAHLAADTIAHNVFVPRQLLLTSSTEGLGHSYWEHRMDVQLGERYTALAREVVMEHDHSAADALFDRVLSSTVFSFRTNRRIFRGMIRFQDNERWQQIFSTVLENSRWELAEGTIQGYLVRSFDFVVDYLRRREDALAAGLDPTGEVKLSLAKGIRRRAVRSGLRNPATLRAIADRHFPIPEVPFGYANQAVADGTPA